MNAQLRQRVIELRIREALSYGEIRKRLGVPKSTLSYWLREMPLSEERLLELRQQGWQKGEVSRERFRATMRKKREARAQRIYEVYQKKLTDLPRAALRVAGLMLYIAEGDKKNPSRIAFANTDPALVKFFSRWLIDFFAVPRERIRVQLHLYENMDIERENEFWRNELAFSASQFYRPEIRKLRRASFSYADSYRHGTCSLYVLGVEKKLELMMAIKALIDWYVAYPAGA